LQNYEIKEKSEKEKGKRIREIEKGRWGAIPPSPKRGPWPI
jgi:hypothetical protein